MYISMVIKVMILIVLIIILTKINILSSSVKTIEKFENDNSVKTLQDALAVLAALANKAASAISASPSNVSNISNALAELVTSATSPGLSQDLSTTLAKLASDASVVNKAITASDAASVALASKTPSYTPLPSNISQALAKLAAAQTTDAVSALVSIVITATPSNVSAQLVTVASLATSSALSILATSATSASKAVAKSSSDALSALTALATSASAASVASAANIDLNPSTNTILSLISNKDLGDPNKDQTLKKYQYNQANNSITPVTRSQFETDKNNKLSMINETEIYYFIIKFKIIADNIETDVKYDKNNTTNLVALSKPFPAITYTYKRMPSETIPVMDKTKLFDYLASIKSNFDTIKRKRDYIIKIANYVRYIQYNYYLSSTYWNPFYTTKTTTTQPPSLPPNSNVNSLYKQLNDVLSRITSAETTAIDLYLNAKGFLTMKEGSDVYKYYSDALTSSKIYNDVGSTKDKFDFTLEPRNYKNNCTIKTTDNKVDKMKDYDRYNSNNSETTFGSLTYYTWKVYDYNNSKYVAESERPKGIYLKDGSSCDYPIRDCKSASVNCRDY